MQPCIKTNRNPFHPGMLCATFGSNWRRGSEVEKKVNKQTNKQKSQKVNGP